MQIIETGLDYILSQLKQELWAVDLDISYHNMVAMSRLFEFATGGKLEPTTHSFVVAPPIKEERKVRRRVLLEQEVIFLIMEELTRFSSLLN